MLLSFTALGVGSRYMCISVENRYLHLFCICKSLWIKASAKCINVNVNIHLLTLCLSLFTEAIMLEFVHEFQLISVILSLMSAVRALRQK